MDSELKAWLIALTIICATGLSTAYIITEYEKSMAEKGLVYYKGYKAI